MGNRIKLLLCCLLSGLTAYAQSNDVPLRIMTYNIPHGAGMDDVLDLSRQAKVIKDIDPDVVGLQEVDSVVEPSGNLDQATWLADSLGMYGTFGPAIPLSGGKYGVAILSKQRPLSFRNIPLPGREPRTLLVCEFEEYVFATTHLDLAEDRRLASLPLIIEEAARWEKPFFICGDWNDGPNSAVITKLQKDFVILNSISEDTSSYTFPADKPTSTIDYIARFGQSTSAVKSLVIDERMASDHRPLIVEVEEIQRKTP